MFEGNLWSFEGLVKFTCSWMYASGWSLDKIQEIPLITKRLPAYQGLCSMKLAKNNVSAGRNYGRKRQRDPFYDPRLVKTNTCILSVNQIWHASTCMSRHIKCPLHEADGRMAMASHIPDRFYINPFESWRRPEFRCTVTENVVCAQHTAFMRTFRC